MQLDASKRLWYNKEGEHIVIGMTDTFLREFQDECWHILPNTAVPYLKEGSPLLTVETNDSLRSLLSPFAGRIIDCSYKAQNDPHCLTQADEVIRLSTKSPEKAKVSGMTFDTFHLDDAVAERISDQTPFPMPPRPDTWAEHVARQTATQAARRQAETRAARQAAARPTVRISPTRTVATPTLGAGTMPQQVDNFETLISRYNRAAGRAEQVVQPSYTAGEAIRLFSANGANYLITNNVITLDNR